MKELIIHGIAASEGVQIGTAVHYGLQPVERSIDLSAAISEEQVEEQLLKLQAAKEEVMKQLQHILERNAVRYDDKQKRNYRRASGPAYGSCFHRGYGKADPQKN